MAERALAEQRRSPRLIRVALVPVGRRDELDLAHLAKQLNSKQTANEPRFEFAVALAVPLPKRKGRRLYEDTEILPVVKNVLRNHGGYQYAIGITSAPLEENSFNRHSCATGPEATRNAGIITIGDWKRYTPPGVSIEQYVAFLVMCESVCLHSGFEEWTHKPECLFDLSNEKHDLIVSLLHADICKDCEEQDQLQKVTEFLPNVRRVLRWVHRVSFASLVRDAVGKPIWMITLGFAANALLNAVTAKVLDPVNAASYSNFNLNLVFAVVSLFFVVNIGVFLLRGKK